MQTKQIVFIMLSTIICMSAVNLDPSFQLTQGQKELHLTNSTKSIDKEELFQPNYKPYNLTYGEWTAKWWQWAYSLPKAVNPAYDDTGRYCSENQQGPVWFFPGTYGKSVIRECAVPIGKAILLPILNSECSFAEFPELQTVNELRMCAKAFQDQVTQLQFSMDGQDVSEIELEEYRIQSPAFNFTLPENNILDLPENTMTSAVSDGNWVFLKPLSLGRREISFRGNINSSTTNHASTESFAFPSGWNYSTTYELVIQ
ncbi:MAG: hypothetical protein WBV84_09180 [Nitrososphaeraceae archaeon]